MVRCLWFLHAAFPWTSAYTGTENRKTKLHCTQQKCQECPTMVYGCLFSTGKWLSVLQKHRPAASHQPFAGIPHCKRSRSPNYKQPHSQLSLHAENVWLPRMETGGTACTAYGFVQSLFLWCHQTLSWNWAGWKGFCLFENRSVSRNLKFFIFGVKFHKCHPI